MRGVRPSDGGRAPLTPLRLALKAFSTTGHAIGKSIRDPSSALNYSLVDAWRDPNRVAISGALRERGMLPGGKAGIALGLAADIFLDPTTYVTLGGGAAARAAGRGIAREAAEEAVSRGRRLTLAERARYSAREAAERAEAPRAVSVGLTVPFTRNRTVWLGESEGLARQAGRIAHAITPDKLRDTISRGLASGRGAGAVVNDVYQDVRRLSAVEARDMARAVRAKNIATRKAAKSLGISHAEATEAISDFLSGMRRDLPDALRPLADDARRLLDDQNAAEIVAGIEKGQLPDYIPFLIARQEDRAAYDRIFGAATANVLDNPFFVRPRNTPDFTTFKRVMRERGIEPETNIWRLIERRGRASLRAQEKKAIDDAITAVHGVKAPPRAVPNVAPLAAKLERERERLTTVSAPRDTRVAQAAAAEARTAEQSARLRLRAARRTGDPEAVRLAREDLDRIRAAAPEEVRAVVARQAEEVLPRFRQIGRDLTATRATLPRPTAGRYELPERPVGVPPTSAEAAGARFLGEEPIAGVRTERAQVLDARRRRARNALPSDPPAIASTRPLTPEGRERTARYFTPETTLSAEQRALREGAEAEVQQAIRKADRAVEKAERRLKTTQRRGSQVEIAQARQALARAEATRRQTRLALERARAGYVGAPREVIAQTKRVQRAERKLTKAERQRGAIILANERQAARAGREVGPEEFAALREEWQEIGQATKYHDGTLLPPEVASSLDQIHRLITPTMRDEDAVMAVSRFMRDLTGRWKALALLSPGYFARNLLDDGLRAYWAGARNPASFVQAARALSGGEGVVRVRGRTYTFAQLVDLAESNGVIRTGYVRTEVASSADETVRRTRFAGPGRGPLARFSGGANELREDATRLGTFLELLKRGDDAGTAGRQVRDFLFDYGEVGAFVGAARRFWLPFITFTSKAIPLTAREFARRPGRAASIGKVMDASEQAAGNPDMSFLPPWSESSFAVPSSAAFRRFIGAPEDQPLILNPERVTGFTTLDMLDPRPDALQRNWGGMVTPFVKSPVEAVTNYSTFKGRSHFENERVWAPWLVQRAAALGIPLPGYGPKKDSYADEYGAGYSPRLDTILRMLPIFGQQASVIPSREGGTHLAALKYSTGLPLSPYDRLRGAYYAEKAGR